MKLLIPLILMILLVSVARASHMDHEGPWYCWTYTETKSGQDSEGWEEEDEVAEVRTLTIEDFRARWPDDFRDFRQSINTSDLYPRDATVWQLFDYRPSWSERCELYAICRQLDDPDFRIRLAARRKLNSPRWIPILMTTKVATLRPETRCYIESRRPRRLIRK